MPDHSYVKEAIVADRIADLRREGDALRAERDRDHLREHAAARTEASDHPVDLSSRRVRLGRWLVAVGEAIAGSRRMAAGAQALSAAATDDDPCGDGRDKLMPAA